MRRSLAIVWLAAVGVTGCGADAGVTPGPEDATGRFAGSDSGVGVALDFTGFDQVSSLVRAGLPEGAARWSVGIVSIVNRSDDAKPTPALFATRPDGRVARIERATRMRGIDGELVAVPGPGRTVAPDTAITMYVLFRGPVVDIRRVEMRIGSEPAVRLSAQTPRPTPATGG